MNKIKDIIRDLLSHSTLKTLVAKMLSLHFIKGQDLHHIVIAAPGGGNIGDQAMLESYIKNVCGSCVVIQVKRDTIKLPSSLAGRAKIVKLDGLIYGWLLPFIGCFLAYKRLLLNAKSVSIIGADIMDGGYSPHASSMRSYIAAISSQKGINTRVLGFSWNSQPHIMAKKAIINAGKAGVLFYARDPLSAQRLTQSRVQNVIESSDLVFSDIDLEPSQLQGLLTKLEGSKVAVVNASGLISNRMNQEAEYELIIEHLLSQDYMIVLLPHVIREGDNDLITCKKIKEKFQEIHLIEDTLAPEQVRALIRKASLAVTGRMHLSIMSLNANVPTIVLSTQGKVEGLLKMFEIEELAVTPQPGFGKSIKNLIDTINVNYDKYIQRISKNVDVVRERSLRNFSGLDK